MFSIPLLINCVSELQAACKSLSYQYHEYFINISFSTTPIQHPLSYKYHQYWQLPQRITMANREAPVAEAKVRRAAETSVQTTRTYENGATQKHTPFSTGNYSSMINTNFKLLILLQREPAANPQYSTLRSTRIIFIF